MGASLPETLNRITRQMNLLIEETRGALRGERNFGVEEIQKLRGTISEMAPIVAENANLRREQPEINGHLDLYQSQLVSCN